VTALRHPHEIAAILERGHELGHHGYTHRRPDVLDVDEQRLVVDATYSPGTSQADRHELALIVRSLRVANPAA
jgi:hypothetical protein